MSSQQLVWLITGTSTGLGRLLTIAALRRGDKVIATARARSLWQLDDLKSQGADTLELDVTASLEHINEFAKKAVAIHGRVDVVVNNAGYVLVGAIEENTSEEQFAQFSTNVFGALNVTRALLPYMRERKSGTVVWMGSLGGWRAVPTAALYGATKSAMRSISMSLHEEIAPIGLRSTCIDFGYFRTDFLTPSHRTAFEPRIPDYTPMTSSVNAALEKYSLNQPGDPQKGVEVVLDIVRGEGSAKGKAWPKKGISLGSDCFGWVKEELEEALQNLETWKEVTVSTDFTEGS